MCLHGRRCRRNRSAANWRRTVLKLDSFALVTYSLRCFVVLVSPNSSLQHRTHFFFSFFFPTPFCFVFSSLCVCVCGTTDVFQRVLHSRILLLFSNFFFFRFVYRPPTHGQALHRSKRQTSALVQLTRLSPSCLLAHAILFFFSPTHSSTTKTQSSTRET